MNNGCCCAGNPAQMGEQIKSDTLTSQNSSGRALNCGQSITGFNDRSFCHKGCKVRSSVKRMKGEVGTG
ncbi:hypothetical protein AA15669_0521 [Saccharibacter floricola DSM 15669]|uniref:Uncharacterized protein n=1 Tax=Saccharibacter floricola DSM 15669 TaxID=1123227 RepID=A0ABQ0NX37_9PROT|nr:hypothetical protein AA15669_0521 [Saccharibacter floricola DSM 15669]